MKQEKEYISLKEASEISGYAPDYIGQLIRAGKLPGKQVFQNVAWMTTKEDLVRYMEKRKGGNQEAPTLWQARADRAMTALKRELELPRVIPKALYVMLALTALLFLLLFYIFASSLEHRIDQRALERAQSAQPI